MWLGHHFQGQKVEGQLGGAGAYCGGLPHSLFENVIAERDKLHYKPDYYDLLEIILLK